MGFFDSLKAKVQAVAQKVSDTLSFDRLKEGLAKTRSAVFGRLASLVRGRTLDDALLAELEEALLLADVGVRTTERILDGLRQRWRRSNTDDPDAVLDAIKAEIAERLLAVSERSPQNVVLPKPYVVMVVGVNGVGKTTTVGKLAYNFQREGKRVIIGAADTFRAAANEQLATWAARAGVEIVQQQRGADPAAVAYDTLNAAIARGMDVCLIDTAGRLHTKGGLMQELEKISRVLKKLVPDAPHDVWLVLDATTGQNAIVQAREFAKVAPLSGLIVTKLDGTAKGGVVLAIADEFQLPVRYIGVGERIDDLQPFDAIAFVEALFAEQPSVPQSVE
ncbi:MAG: signal recognition particle-docking protein FtsY [Chlorobi bacterium NICIL-2]|nr:MAG: signal recognition particle-docking protein FtsY [Chlorobi bacterium NICIL-2]